MTKWLINTEDIMEEVEFKTLQEVMDYILDHVDVRELDNEGCEV